MRTITIFLTLFFISGCSAPPKSSPLGNGMGDGGERLYLASREVHQTHLNHYLTKYFPLSEEDKIHYLY